MVRVVKSHYGHGGRPAPQEWRDFLGEFDGMDTAEAKDLKKKTREISRKKRKAKSKQNK